MFIIKYNLLFITNNIWNLAKVKVVLIEIRVILSYCVNNTMFDFLRTDFNYCI